MSIVQGLYNLKKLHLFAGIAFLNILISWLSNRMLVDEVVFYNTFSDQLTWDRAMNLFGNLKNIAWLGYITIPIILFIKFSVVSLILYSGAFMFNLHNELTLGSIFRVLIISEIIIILAGLVKFLWFLFFAGNYTLHDLNFFYPLSLINLFRIEEVSQFWIFPLQMVNLFQIIYILSLSYGLYRSSGITQSGSEKIILATYLPALIVWVAFIMFLTLDTAVI